MDIKKYLIDRLEDQKVWYGNKANFNKKRFMNYQMLVIILGASIPILVVFFSIHKDWAEYQGIVTAIISSIITVIVGIDKLQNPQTNWYNYRANEEKLKKEGYLYEYRVGSYRDLEEDEAQRMLVENVENIVSSDVVRFVQHQKSKEDEAKSKTEKLDTKKDDDITENNDVDNEENKH